VTVEAIREDIRQKGEAARQLLASDFYVLVLNDLASFHTLAMSESEVGKAGRKAREEHHTLLNALAEINRQVGAYAQQLDDLEDAEHREAEDALTQPQDIE
jgi:hypothetical protein